MADPNFSQLTPSEIARVGDILQAAIEGSWQSFQALSDADFPNLQSMQEQFRESSKIISPNVDNWQSAATVAVNEDETRNIHVMVPVRPGCGTPIDLMIQVSREGKMTVWVFYQRFDITKM